MKRTWLLLSLILAITISGCCYAPGYENSSILDARPTVAPLDTVDKPLFTDPTDPADETTAPTQPSTTVIDLPDREDSDLVDVQDYMPDIFVELKYATTDNFTGNVLYDFTVAYLRYGTVQKLMRVQQELEAQGLSLKIWDAFRPTSAHDQLWKAYPDPTYVSDPANGYSSHCRGNTVDVTIVDSEGREVEMPSGFDEFSEKADRDYSDCSDEAEANAKLLQNLMAKYGFSSYQAEWWHFSDETVYAVEEAFDPGEISIWYADCEEFISLRTEPSTSATVILKILVNERFTLLGWTGNFAYVEYEGVRGYVHSGYIQPVE